MADDVVIAKFTADLGDLQAKFDTYIKSLEKLDGKIEDVGDTSKTTSKTIVRSLKEEEAELAKLEKQFKETFDVKGVKNLSAQINESKTRIKQLKDETKKAGTEATNLGSSFKKSLASIGAGVAAAFSINAILNFSRSAIDAFAELEKSRVVFNNLVGDAIVADRLFNELRDFSVKTPFTPEQVQESARALLQFGVANEEVLETVKLLGDVSAGTGKDLKELSIIFGQIKSTGRLMGQDLLQLINAGFNPLQQISEDTGKSIIALKKEMEQGKISFEQVADAFKSATSEGGKFNNLTEQLATTTAGRLSTLEGQAQELSATIGEKLAPAFLAVRTAALSAFSDMIDGFRSLFDEAGLASERFTDQQKDRFDILAAGVDAIFTKFVEQGLKPEAALIKSIAQEEKRLNKEIAEALKNVLKPGKEGQKAAEDRLDALKSEKDELVNINRLIEQRIQKEKDLKLAQDIEAQLAQQEKLKKLFAEQRKLYDQQLEAIKKYEASATEEELKERQKRDDAFFDSLEKRRKAQEDANQKSLDLQKKANEIQLNEELAATAKLDEATRRSVGRSLEEELTRDLNAKKAKLNLEAEIADFQRRQDIANEIIILEKATADQIADVYKKLGLDKIQSQEDFFTKFSEEISATQSLLSELTSLYSAFTDAQLDRINTEKEARLNSIDEQLNANEDALKKNRISEQQAANNEKRLLDEKVKAEETAAKKEREIKRKQAILDKANALAQIAINTAQAISKALTTGPGAPALVALYAALGAAQAAVVLAQPIPYKKGTKGAKGGLSLVGEEGPEMTVLPQGTKVIPAKQTKKYSKVFDAMVDDQFESYIFKTYITPELDKRRRTFEDNKQESFAKNIASSIQYNNTYGVDPESISRTLRKGSPMTNVDELADAIASRIKTNIYRR